ncbi:MAG: lysophospholipid acyltransferase family protein, partial [Endomicrobium sp.]|nr:lysophospholipid acyltransferase family protein [Endomicrobium sp.]
MPSKNLMRIIIFICRIIDKTLRKKPLNDTFHYPKPSIYSFWHGNTFPMMFSNQKSNIVIMASLSKDGEILSQVLKKYGYLTVRGSSSKSGGRALIEIIRYARKGYSIAFGADGPKGLYHKFKYGAVYAAQKTGMLLLPISCSPKNKIVINKSWDKMIIPLPFSKMVQIYGEPFYIDDGDDIEEKAVLVEEKLNKLFEFTGKYYWE